MAHPSIFRLSLLSFALLGGAAAYAETENKATELPAVQVSGKRTITNNWKTNAERNVADVRDVLADRADINVGGGSVSAQYLSIRGTGQNRVDMVVDGTTTAAQLWYHQGRFQLDPAMVRVIGVDKGAGSASAGIGATSGAVRAQTVDAKDLLRDGKPFGARIATQYNSNKGVGGNLAVYGNRNGFDGLLMGSWLNNKDYKDGKKETVLNSARKQGNYLAKFGYSISPDHTIGASFRREHFYGNIAERPEFTFVSDEGQIDTVQQTANLNYAGKNIGFIRDVDANLFYIQGEDERTNWQRVPDPNNKGKNLTIDGGGKRKSYTYTTGSNINLSSSLLDKHVLKYGINWRNERNAGEAGGGRIKGERKNEVGVYAEGIWSLEPVTLTTGLRYDHFDLRTVGKKPGSPTKAAKGSLNPSLGVIWDVTPDLSLNAKLNYASRSPALSSAYTITDNRGAGKARGWRDVASGLKPERARLAELGFNWQHEGIGVSGSVFHQEVKNFYSAINSSPIDNRGTVKTKGYDVAANYSWKGLNARMGVSYADPKADFPLSNDALDIVPQGRQWRTGLSYRFDNPKLEIGWRGRYAQAKRFVSGNNRDEQHRNGYGVHDIYANWQPMGDAMNVNVAVNNVGNKYYRSHSQRVSAAAHPNPGREVRVGVNYRF